MFASLNIARRSQATFTATLKSFKSRVSQLLQRGGSHSNQHSNQQLDLAFIVRHRIVKLRLDDLRAVECASAPNGLHSRVCLEPLRQVGFGELASGQGEKRCRGVTLIARNRIFTVDLLGIRLRLSKSEFLSVGYLMAPIDRSM